MSEEEKKQKVLDMWDKESLANEWVKEHIKYNYTKEDLDQAQEIIIELQQRIDKANEILSKSCFEYDNCPDSIINEIIELKKILGDKE